jgi:glutamate dehydrogenase
VLNDPDPVGLADPAVSRIVAPTVAMAGTEPERAAVVDGFARAVLRRVPPAQLAEADPAALAGVLAAAFDFVDRRPPGEIAVRVIDPPLALDGVGPPGSVIEISCDDRQFIFTSVKEELHRLGQPVARVLHPVYGCERDGAGRLAAVVPARTADRREAYLQVVLGARVPEEGRAPLVGAVRRVLVDVFAVTDDHTAMREELVRVGAATMATAGRRYPPDEVSEAVDLLAWLLDGNFVLLGCCRVRPTPADDGAHALGILADPSAPLRAPGPGAVDGSGGDGPPPLLRVAPTRQISTVHRQVPIHRVEVAEVGPAGEVVGLFRLVGVFSNKATVEPSVLTPVLRFKLRRVLELEDVVEGSQDEATLVSLFQVLPKEELFEADVATLREVLVGLLAAEDQQDVRALLRVDQGTGTVSALLSIPQELYTPTLRLRLERFLVAQLDGTRVDAQVSLGDRADAVLRLVVHVDGPLPRDALDPVARELRLLCRTWDQELAGALAARPGPAAAAAATRVTPDWFPATYRDAVTPAQAVDDVLHVDRLAATAAAGGPPVAIVLATDPTGAAHARLKVFSAGPPVELSRFLPILESLGLWAVEEVSYALGPRDGRVHLHDFGVNDPARGRVRIDRDGARLADAATALWHGRADVDSLNRLVLRAGVSWDDVALLRAYHRYRNQVGTTFTTAYVAEVLVENAPVTRALLDLFAARFDPALATRPEVVAGLRQRVVEGCDAVARLDHDRILRGFLALVEATLRTNRYLGGDDHLALKFESAAVPGVRRPVPYREIFVYGPAVEGVHLRWGPVARGGIRWSERPDDYRRETLGLMRTQVLKNALIVPTGAKGGFVVKRRPYGDARPVGVREGYERFVTCLLELTDNVVGDRVVGVPGRRDGDDPYLVVAADRGTADLSDLANRLSEERGFWLGDAFASGGSRGYDHKHLGITARGAWVAVRHHLAQLGVDLDGGDDVTVAGIGDMSGDVFGNGMLHSDRIRLVAAFDHRHVFVDPDPDPAASYRERARLSALPGSSWGDYDPAALSPGGGVWSRLDKRIELSPQARAALGVDEAQLTPAELIRAVLRAPVTLLFAGGIGTFVRAGDEPDQDIDDRANTDVRVEAASLRARVVGEGANLAFTQRARVEFARRGGRINTDAIDNSAGVDISDHEVNVKILLRAARETGALTGEARDRLLAEVCPEVVEAVLRDSAQQSLALSRAEAASPGLADAIEDLMVDLEREGVLDRVVEALPSADEIRARGEPSLTRPELAVLLAGAKRSLTGRLLASPVPDEPALRSVLAAYFPAALAARFDHLLDGHRLRRELIASEVANDLVDRMGPTFVHRLMGETGAEAARVAAAYCIARGVIDAPGYWRLLDGDDGGVGGGGLVEAAAPVAALLERLTRAYLRRGECSGIAEVVARDHPAFAELRAAMPSMGTPARRAEREARAAVLAGQGLDPEPRRAWACLEELEIVPDVAEVARRAGRTVTGVGDAFLRVGEALGTDRLADRLRRTAVADRWARAAAQGVADDLDDVRLQAAIRALEAHPGDEAEAVRRFLAGRAALVGRALAVVEEVESERRLRLDAVAVAVRAIRRAVA